MGWAKHQENNLRASKRYLKNGFKVGVSHAMQIPPLCCHSSQIFLFYIQNVCDHTLQVFWKYTLFNLLAIKSKYH